MRFLFTLILSIFIFISNSYAKQFYGDADSRAYRVPEKYFENLDSLTDYLIEPFKNN